MEHNVFRDCGSVLFGRYFYSDRVCVPHSGERTVATYSCPCMNTGDGKYIFTRSKVCLCGLFMVTEKANRIGNCTRRNLNGKPSSPLVVNGILGKMMSSSSSLVPLSSLALKFKRLNFITTILIPLQSPLLASKFPSSVTTAPTLRNRLCEGRLAECNDCTNSTGKSAASSGSSHLTVSTLRYWPTSPGDYKVCSRSSGSNPRWWNQGLPCSHRRSY